MYDSGASSNYGLSHFPVHQPAQRTTAPLAHAKRPADQTQLLKLHKEPDGEKSHQQSKAVRV